MLWLDFEEGMRYDLDLWRDCWRDCDLFCTDDDLLRSLDWSCFTLMVWFVFDQAAYLYDVCYIADYGLTIFFLALLYLFA